MGNVVTEWWGDSCSVPGGTGRRMLKNPGNDKRGHGDVLLDRWSGRLGPRPHRKSSVSMPSQRTSARWTQGEMRDRGGLMQKLATHSPWTVAMAAVQQSVRL